MAASNISGSWIAQECGVSRQAVSKWEHGKNAPSSENLMKFCKMTGCSVEWLMEPTALDIRSTLRAPDGISAKALVRAVIEEMQAPVSSA
jgi:transcriptional regulator with XRE-family HTH domain